MRIKNRAVFLFSVLTILFTADSFGQMIAGKWKIDYVDPNIVHSGPTITLLNSSGKPHLVSSIRQITGINHHFRDSNAWDVNSQSWDDELIEPADCSQILGIDISNDIRIVYRTNGGALRYAEKTNGAWQAETIAAPGSGYNRCFAVNQKDEPVMLVREGDIFSYSMKLCYRDDGPIGKVWVSTILDTAEAGRWIGDGSIICDDSNGVHVSYLKDVSSDITRLYYKKFVDGKWQTAPPMDILPGAEITDVIVDDEGNFYVLFCDLKNIMVNDGNDWSIIDYSNEIFLQCEKGTPRLNFDSNGRLQIRKSDYIYTYEADSNSWSMDYFEQKLSNALNTSIHYGIIMDIHVDNLGNTCVSIADPDVNGVVHCQYVPDSNTIAGIEISGPETVSGGSGTRYKASGRYDNYTTKDITDSVEWTLSDETYASINGNSELVAGDVEQQQEVILRADYQIYDLSFSDEKKINILPAWINSDLDKDGSVNLGDFAIMAAGWLQGEK